jgi:Cu+-exporting ATPase
LKAAPPVDQPIVTGKSIPIDKNVEDKVIGATINETGLLKVRASIVERELSTLAETVLKAAKQKEVSISDAERFEAIPGQDVKATYQGKEIL